MTAAQDMGQRGMDFLMEKGPGIIGAVITLVIGFWIIGRIVKMTEKVMVSRNMDASLIPFLKSLLNIILKAVLIISAAGMIGIETTSFIAILGAAGLAVGLALQGTLQNFAGGVLILMFKPYKVGDLVNTQGHLGVVKEIQIFVTILLTPENKTVIIPNGAISNGDITNFTVEGVIRVDMVMGISYDSDIKAARKALMEVMEAHPLVLKDPAPFVGVVELADSAVNLAVRPYADPNNYWDVYFDIYESGKEALDKAGITIPFPQIDVHMEK
ncbi:MAG: mechanosensitive ion channel [Flavobacteriales bacterium]|nr:mechanosensitive ion channel [Flavobacteriales bacterium]